MALVIRKAVKELCKTLSCLLGNLGRQKYNSSLNKSEESLLKSKKYIKRNKKKLFAKNNFYLI